MTRSTRTLRTCVLALVLLLPLSAVRADAAPGPALADSRAGAAPAAVPATVTAAAAPALDPGLPSSGPDQRVVVTGDGAAAAVRAAGGAPGASLDLVGGVAATVPSTALRALAAAPGVRAVTADRAASLVDFSWDESSLASTFVKTTGGTASWTRGHQGKGVGIAVLDTGVSPSPDLAGRLVHGPDLSGEGTLVDTYGHGTVMAGLAAGSGADSATRSGGSFTGMAPAAHVVSVKVAGRNGVVDVSTVLQAMHWVSAYRAQLGIRVLNLSWGVPSTQHPSVDPLNHAVQRLWAQGIVVVVAAGNSGSSAGTILKPADDPVVLTVGALNEEGDLEPGNDTVPQWSSRGPTAAGVTKPDLVAPGRTVVALRSRGSTVEANHGRALVGSSYIKGSGTSQAAAVASGAVALLLSARPGLTPDQVKDVLMSSAAPLPGVPATVQGRGRLQVEAATQATPAGTTQSRTAGGLGSLDASRGEARVQAVCGGVLQEIRGEIDVRCQPWDAGRWAGSSWTGASWTGDTWAGATWTGSAWRGGAWTDATWNGSGWTGGTWAGGSWFGSGSWTGDASATSTWTAVSWKDATWSAVSWKSAAWTTGDWTTGTYDEFQSAFWGATPPAGVRLPGEAYTAPAGKRR